ncbi:Beta-glucosidase 12 [Apostasia shenzhenica]|uniref:Beta-glucosidase 12 n=1 Tax=Apostasia shenzhenica TaxID=1088818 RepID=A0A2I0BG08_9ASPA|nr:Beta-glucosidase 12 [Apostasia shenzhenica]
MALPLARLSTPKSAAGHEETLRALGFVNGCSAISSSLKRGALRLPQLARTPNPSPFICASAETQTRQYTPAVLTLQEDLPEAARVGRKSFPPDFVFGAATAAYQVEGAANEGGRTPSIWDTFTHKFPNKIGDGSNGDVAADAYHRYKEDVQLVKELGMDAYRFSISWSRVLPKGRGKVNEEGVKFYNNLINELRDNGIEPYVTLYHWDLPQVLEDEYGGFLSDKVVEDYKNFANLCFSRFGDRVSKWTTFNEPLMFATAGYGLGMHAPGRCTDGLELGPGIKLNCPAGGDSLKEPYIVAHNILRCHAEAVHLYREKYKAEQNGEIGITLVSHWFEPIDSHPFNSEAQERCLQFNLGWFLDPIKFGDYPHSMRSLVRERLPFFTEEETAKLKESFDFVGLNYYTARYAVDQVITKDFQPLSYIDDSRAQIRITDLDGIPIEHAEPGSWINVHPRGLREMLLYIQRRYDDPAIYITENGVMEKDNKEQTLQDALDDTHRSEYLTLHLHELKEAVRRGVNVKGYFTWSLLDNFEWQDGYKSRLGLHYIDYYKEHQEHLKEESELKLGHSPPHLRRIPKQSTLWFKRFLAKNL